eukprot:scaffold82574_cov74-Cyclotella_meneghiniana.AAC.4
MMPFGRWSSGWMSGLRPSRRRDAERAAKEGDDCPVDSTRRLIMERGPSEAMVADVREVLMVNYVGEKFKLSAALLPIR